MSVSSEASEVVRSSYEFRRTRDWHWPMFAGRAQFFWEKVVSLLPESRTIADVWCGEWEKTNFLVSRFPNSRIYGIDNCPIAVWRAQNQNIYDSVSFREWDAFQLWEQGLPQVDLICLFQILHHYDLLNSKIVDKLIESIYSILSVGWNVAILDTFRPESLSTIRFTILQKLYGLISKSPYNNVRISELSEAFTSNWLTRTQETHFWQNWRPIIWYYATSLVMFNREEK